MKGRILVIEDELTTGTLYQDVLEDAGFQVDWLRDGDEAMRRINAKSETFPYEAILTDYHIPGITGMDLLKAVQRVAAKVPVVFVTAHGNVDMAIEAMREGALDYLEKPVDLDQLVSLLKEAISDKGQVVQAKVGSSTHIPSTLVGRSPGMINVYKQIGRIAATPATVLIRGETGTGKELVARALHQFSTRKDEPFVAVNCGAIPENLLESELFGYERGAFTGADTQHIGRFERANGGTLFLDEIGDMPWDTQVKILRVLQERRIQRIGGNAEVEVDVRIVAATHQNLEEMIGQNRFREDLFHRLAVAEIQLPPLRERKEDIPLLVDFFLQRFASEFGFAEPSIEKQALLHLQAQPWSGNVRQLQNVIRGALLRGRNQVITSKLIEDAGLLRDLHGGAHLEEDFPLEADSAKVFDFNAWIADRVRQSAEGAFPNLRKQLSDEMDRLLITHAMEISQGNKTRMAEILGVTRKTLRQRMTQLEINDK